MRRAEPKPPMVRADLDGKSLRIALLASRYNEDVCDTLLRSAREGLEAHGVEPSDVHVHRVPGAFELVTAANWAARSGRFDAVIGLGCVIKGETDHDVYINHAVADGFARISVGTGVPVILGVLTTNHAAQAEARANPSYGGGKGWECALAAIEMVRLRASLGDPASPTRGETGTSRAEG